MVGLNSKSMAEHRNPALKSGVSYSFSLITIEEFMKIYTTNAASFLSRWTHLGGLTLTPGLYKSSGSLEISSGDLTFDAKWDANAFL